MNLARTTARLRWPLLAAFAASAAIVLPATAHAIDYCVAPNTTCGGSNVASLEEALDLADNADDADRIFLGDATYTAPTTAGYLYDRPTGALELIGAGTGTELTAPSGSLIAVLRLFSASGSSVHDLRIHMPASVGSGFSGLDTFASARNVSIDEDPTQSQPRRGVLLKGGAALEDSSVQLGPDSSVGVLADFTGGSVRGSSLAARTGFSSNGPALLERSSIDAAGTAVSVAHNTTLVKSSLLRIAGASGTAISTVTQQSTVSTVLADGVTMIGPGTALSNGVSASTVVFPAESTHIDIANSLIRNFGRSFKITASGSGAAAVQSSFSDYDPSTNQMTGANASLTEDHATNLGDAHFVDVAAGDFHLLPGSPLVDAGDPAAAAGSDLDGNSLPVDGDDDGIARRDIGAYELLPVAQPPSPGTPQGAGSPQAAGASQGVPATTQTPDTQAPVIASFARRGSTFHFKLSEAARVALTVGRVQKGHLSTVLSLKKSAASGANAIRLSRKRLRRPGIYRATLVAVDAAGNHSKALRIRFRIR